MDQLWFRGDSGDVSRPGGMRWAARPDGLWAVLLQELVHPDDPEAEAAELLGQYGALVHGLGHLLLGEGQALGPELTAWSTAPAVPLSELRGWAAGLVEVAGEAHLALGRAFEVVRATVATVRGRHLVCFTPPGVVVPHLVEG